MLGPFERMLKSKIEASLDYMERIECMVMSPYELLHALYPVETSSSSFACDRCSKKGSKRKSGFVPSSGKDSPLKVEDLGIILLLSYKY